MYSPLVTVFMAVYNEEKHISEALESILNQSYRNLEILIVNDASTDRSLEIIKSYDDKRIRIINNEVNKGIPFTRNVGINEAKGKYIAVMDSDDISCKNRIEKQVEFMEKNPDISVIGTNYTIFGDTITRKVTNRYVTPEELKIKLLFSSPIANPSAMIRKSTLEKYNIKYNLNYFVAQDYDLWLQISKVSKLCILPDHLIKYRISSTNISSTSRRKKALKRKKIINTIHEDALTYHGFSLTKEEMQTYNDFFSDSPVSEYEDQFLNNIVLLIDKLNNQNINKKIFEGKMFKSILLESSLFAVSNLSCDLNSKLRVYSELCNALKRKKQYKDIIYIILKHCFSCLKRKL